MLGQVVKVRAGHPMEGLGRGTVQVLSEGDAVKVAFPMVTLAPEECRCLLLWFQAADLEPQEVAHE